MDENTNVTPEAKTFTQDELKAIVADRLAREKAKYEGFEEMKAKAEKYASLEEANKTELQKASERVASLEAQLDSMKKSEAIRAIRDKVSNYLGVPAKLLTADTEEACIEQANAIKEYATPAYPSVKDAGEVRGTTKVDTRTQYAEWASKAFD